jgi:hypothetical protein
VALTLPLDVIERLHEHDSDLARAIVGLTARSRPQRVAASEAGLAQFGRRAVIVVSPSPTLRRLPGIELVPLPSGRALISLDRGLTPEAFELRLRDALDAGAAEADSAGIREVLRVLGDARRAKNVRLEPRTILVLESTRSQRGKSRPGGA